MEYIWLILYALTLLTCYTLYGTIKRLYLSPIAHIPGPKLAILSFWYEFYYDVILKGRYTWKIAKLHQQYGPVIRINPFEVHIDDPDFYDEVYVLGSKRKSEKWAWSVPMFGAPNGILATVDHDLHRRRRQPYQNFFSKQSIRKYSNVIQSTADRLCSRMAEHQALGKKINLMHAWSAFTGDVVTAYSFPRSYGLLDQPDFAPDFFQLWVSILSNSHILKQFPWIFPTMQALPERFAEKFLPDLAATYKWQKEWRRQIGEIKASMPSNEKGAGELAAHQEKGNGNIFETLLSSDLPPQERSVERLMEDAQNIVGAGSTTTSSALALATYYIITDPPILDKLMTELTTAMPDPHHQSILPLLELEKLPYLSAVILEVMRISYGASHRLQRVSPEESFRYQGVVLPAGTPVSMSTVLIHDNEGIFPEPRAFKPERWLPLETTGAALQKHLVSFSRGSRQCLGMYLAWAELYIGLASVFGRFGGKMRIVDTVRERDVELCHDFFLPAPKVESEGIMMVIDRD